MKIIGVVVVALAVPDRPAPDGEQERSDRDADGRPVQLEIPRQDNESPRVSSVLTPA